MKYVKEQRDMYFLSYAQFHYFNRIRYIECPALRYINIYMVESHFVARNFIWNQIFFIS